MNTELQEKMNQDYWFKKLMNSKPESELFDLNEGNPVEGSMVLDDELVELIEKTTNGNRIAELVLYIFVYNLLLNKCLYVDRLWINTSFKMDQNDTFGSIFSDCFFNPALRISEVIKSIGDQIITDIGYKNYNSEDLRLQLKANGVNSNYFDHFKIVFDTQISSKNLPSNPNSTGTTLIINTQGQKKCLSILSNDFFLERIHPENFVGSYITLMRKVLSSPHETVNSMNMFFDQTYQQKIQNIGAGIKIKLGEENVLEKFEKICHIHPDHTAIEDGDLKLTYKDLYKYVDRLANYIICEQKKEKGTVIAVYMSSSAWAVISCIAIMKSGCVYMPLDTKEPHGRTTFKLKDSKAQMVILNSCNISNFLNEDLHIFAIDVQLDTLHKRVPNHPRKVFGRDPAYILYTSGSTGFPKGAKILHMDIVNLVHGLLSDCEYQTSSEIQKVAMVAPISFDPSIQQIFSTLCKGRTLVIVPSQTKYDGAKLVHFFCDREIDRTDMTPSHLRLISEYLEEHQKPLRLKQIWIGGEALSSRLVNKFQSSGAQNIDIINLYGLTECCVDTTYYRVTPKIEPSTLIPIGRVLENKSTMLLDRQKQPCLIGGIGELAIEVSSSHPYLKDELNKKRVIKNPFYPEKILFLTGDLCYWDNGNLCYKGRVDEQIKCNGFRIEPQEIVRVIEEYKDVNKAHVIKDSDREILVAFVISDSQFKKESLVRHLKRSFPDYMIPSEFHSVTEFPLGIHGKIDSKKLLKNIENTGATKSKIYLPTTDIEKKIQSIWSEVLKIPISNIGIKENFFLLGGNSLKAAKVVYQLFKKYQIDTSIEALFMHPTILQLGQNVIADKDLGEITPIPQAKYYPTSSSQNRIWLDCALDTSGIAYNMPYAIELEGDFQEDYFFNAINLLIKRHEILRTSFHELKGALKQSIHSKLEIASKFEDFSTLKNPIEELNAKITKEFHTRFDISKIPLIRFTVFKLEDAKYVVSFLMHHIIGDGWSVQLMLKEVFELYDSLNSQDQTPLKFPQLQYKDYANWLQLRMQNTKAKNEKFWKEQLSDIEEVDLLVNISEKKETFRGNSLKVVVPPEVQIKLGEYARHLGVNEYIIPMAAYAFVLHKYSFKDEFLIGYPVSGRYHPDSHNILGCFVNMLPIKILVNTETSFESFLEHIGNQLRAALENQEISYGEILRIANENRSKPLNSLFNMVFLGQNEFNAQGISNSFSIKNYEMSGIEIAHFDLMMSTFVADDQMEIDLNYSTDFFEENTVRQMQNHIIIVMKQILNNPSIILNKIQLEHKFVPAKRTATTDLQRFQF